MSLVKHSVAIDDLASPSGPSVWREEVPKSSGAIIDEAYKRAVTLFKQRLTESEYKAILKKGGIEDVQAALQKAKVKYDTRKSRQSGIYSWLSMFSSRLMYYGVILDTLAQHHPEYVSLAWGTIKFLFVAVLNYEELISRLSEAFVQIADALPRAKLKLELYGTENMLAAVAQLYAQIMRFSERAIKWYTDSKIKHIYHSIAHPYSLSYKDIIEEIDYCSERIEQLATNAAQAEQREIHMRMINLERLILAQHGSIVSSGLLNTPFQLRNIEVSQILAFVDKTPLPETETSLAYQLAIRNRHIRDDPKFLGVVEQSKKLSDWSLDNKSALIILKGSFKDRGLARAAAASIIAAIKKKEYPVVWSITFKSLKASQQLSSLDILKHLVLQVLQKNKSLLADRSRPLSAMSFQCATTESEWFELLAQVLEGLAGIYIIIDIELLRKTSANGQLWPALFADILKRLENRSPETIIKVAIVSYHTQLSIKGPILTQKNILHLSKRRNQDISVRRAYFNLEIRRGSRFNY